jgi:hypothetical protein
MNGFWEGVPTEYTENTEGEYALTGSIAAFVMRCHMQHLSQSSVIPCFPRVP